MKRILAILCILVPSFCIAADTNPANEKLNQLQQRAKQIAPMLSPAAQAVLPSIEDRKAWEQISASGNGAAAIRQAESLLKSPFPEMADDVYLDFTKTGNRDRGQKVIGDRRNRFPVLVSAECLENKGRFLPEIERLIGEYCKEKSWTLPAHDRSLDVFNGKGMYVDLASSAFSWDIATAYRILGKKLSEPTRKLIVDNLEKRCLQPYESSVKTGSPRMWWIKGSNNWNAVCHAGVVGTALALIDDPLRRAWFIAAAEMNTNDFINGFTSDGYCNEGLGYWGYGFGNYIKLSEMIRRATKNKINLLRNPFCEKISQYPRRISIINNIIPAYADCGINVRPNITLMTFLNAFYGWNIQEYNNMKYLTDISAGSFTHKALLSPDNQFVPARKSGSDIALRDYFDKAGILVCRPSKNPVSNNPKDRDWNKLSASFKAGHNNESHNHNDVGTYVVIYRNEPILLDVGGEVYTARTFSKNRYDSRVLNSWGHAVPMIGGVLQSTGANAKGVVTKAAFSDAQDVFGFDFKSCYDIKTLEKLNRTFVYNRIKNCIIITDQFQLSDNDQQEFNEALITLSDAVRSGNKVIVGKPGKQFCVEVNATTVDKSGKTTNVEWDFKSELCNENQGNVTGAKRLGIILPKVNNATVIFTITGVK